MESETGAMKNEASEHCSLAEDEVFLGGGFIFF